ncbi:MAG: flavodoxin family protein [Pseudomonadota bacterium]
MTQHRNTAERRTLCLLGSPRPSGNSETLARRFCQRAVDHGAPVQQVALSELSYGGCRNLFRCKGDLPHCGQKDDLTPVLESITQSDVLVLASPVYFTNLTGQLKSVIDRFFSFLVPDYPNQARKSRLGPGRRLILVQTQGEGEDRYGDLLERYATGFRLLGFEHQFLIRAWGVREAGDVVEYPAFLERCDAVAQQIYGQE